MAYDSSHGRGAEPSYFDPADHSTYHSAEPRDGSSARATSNAKQRSNPKNRMTASPERSEPAVGFDNVSSDLIAEITERVKRELVEHLNRTGNVEELPKAPPLQRQPSNKSNSTSSPPPNMRRIYTPPSPTQAQSQAPKPTSVAPSMNSGREPARESFRESVREPAKDVFRSPPSSPLDKPSGVRFTDRTPAVRPQTGRTFSTMELSTIDQKWGRLFDNDGHPTQRLGQFLRGLANHIIDDVKPEKSIVITPTKMAHLYASHPLDKEPNQLLSIFRGGRNDQISRFYQDLGCQHHLIQDHSSNSPTIPALTPLGFAQWMTINVLAYPDEESKRLENIVLAMPIDADGEMVDGKPERLPKQISRHLLPGREDRKSRKLLNNAVLDFLDDVGSSNRRKASIASPPLSRHSSTSQSRPLPVEIHQVRTSPTTSKAKPIERERNPYAGSPSAESSGNEEPVKIERDRQPYTAQPGSGKIYNESSNLDSSKLGRTNSTTRPRESEPEPVVETREVRHQRARSNASQNPYVPGIRSGGRRTSSPPLKKYSDSTPVGLDLPGSKYGPGPSSTASSFSTQSQPASFPPPPPPIDIRDNRERRRDDYHRRGTGTDEAPRFTGEFNSPKDAEKWDRYQEARDADRTDRPYERGSISIDPRDTRDAREASRDSKGPAYEDWYRDKPRAAPAYESYPRNYRDGI